MALITISGYPSSGKSTRAKQIKDALESRIAGSAFTRGISVISDDELHISKSSYASSKAEKPARGTLFAALQREIASDKLLILDSMNYIKGWRYQVYCAAREAGVRVCTVYVLATKDLCIRWNSGRPSDVERYDSETLDNLIMRYEEPSSMVRWDSPLFTIPWDLDMADLPIDDMWKAITQGNVKPPNSGTLSTQKPPTDALHVLESTASQVVSAIMNEQSSGLHFGGPVTLRISSDIASSNEVKVSITLPARNIPLPELQRLKRQFVQIHKKAVTTGTTEKACMDWNAEGVSAKFGQFLEEHLM